MRTFLCYFLLVGLLSNLHLSSSQEQQYLPVRIVHAVKDGPPFDVWMNEDLVFSNVTVGTVTDFHFAKLEKIAQNSDQLSVIVLFYHAGTTNSYFNSILSGEVLSAQPTGINGTVGVLGTFHGKNVFPVAAYSVVAPSDTLAYARFLFWGANSTETLTASLSAYQWGTKYHKMDVAVKSGESTPYSVFTPRDYAVQIKNSNGNVVWKNDNITFIPGNCYSFLATGSIASESFSVDLLIDSSASNNVNPVAPTPAPTLTPTAVPVTPSSQGGSSINLWPAANIIFAFLTGCIITYFITKYGCTRSRREYVEIKQHPQPTKLTKMMNV